MVKLGIVLVGVLLLALGLTATLKRPPQESWQDKWAIQSVARRAKAEGKTAINIPGPLVEYPGIRTDIDDVLQKYSALVAEVVESNTYLSDTDVISTAYKFRIIESIKHRNAAFCNTCPPVKDVSDKVHPAFSNEFILQVYGGTLTVDGVEVTMVDTGGLKFKGGEKYLLLVSFTPGGMATLAAGPSGVFRVGDNDSLEPISRSTYPVSSQVATRFSNKLSKFKDAAKRQ
jgi:hypothetical protein